MKSPIKALTYVFGAGLAAIAVSLVMTIVTGVRQHHQTAQESLTNEIPLPATGR
ncbi:MAG: hypothetical protein ACXWPM_08670 [Bdellovibrionota bacterium]